jgi:hypothetical protein
MMHEIVAAKTTFADAAIKVILIRLRPMSSGIRFNAPLLTKLSLVDHGPLMETEQLSARKK